MAFAQTRLCILFSRSGSLLSRQIKNVTPCTFEGQRHLTTDPQYKKPFPYQEKRFRLWHALFDFTTSRLNDNSRILMIEGPPCVGKTEFAQNLADRFKLKYLPAITDDELFMQNGFDLRQMNEMLPTQRLRYHDLNSFYAEPDPKKMMVFGGTQALFFEKHYYQYVEALQHLLNTGQGVILETNVWSDACYALNLADLGYFTRRGIKWYMDYRAKTLDALWKPHLVIHLDAPSSLVVKRMKDKHPELENSPVVTEKYFDGLREKYQKIYLPFMEKYCDTLTYDVTRMEDFDLLAMDIENMDLISSRFGESKKFGQWKKKKEEEWSMYRLHLCNPRHVNNNINWRQPYNCPELYVFGEEAIAYWKVATRFQTQNDLLPNVRENPLGLAREDPRYSPYALEGGKVA